MVHDRISNQGDFQQVFDGNARLIRSRSNQFAYRFTYCRGHLARAFRIEHRVRDTAHQVFPEADLRIHRP